MSDHEIDDIAVRLARLEVQQDEERKAMKPLLDLYNAGKLIGRIFIIVAGSVSGLIAAYTFLADYFGRHWK